MITKASEGAVKAKVIKEWATQQSPYTLNKVLKWSKTITETCPGMGEASSYELIAEVIAMVGDKWKKYQNT